MMASMLLALTLAIVPLPQGPAGVDFVHRGDVPRETIVPVSLPLPLGSLRMPRDEQGVELPCTVEVTCGERLVRAPARPLEHWRDGSVAVLQVQPRVELPANGTLHAELAVPRDADGGALRWPIAPHRSLVRQPLPLWTELVDPWGRVYRARLEPDDAAGPGGVLSDTGVVRVVQFRSSHRATTDGGATGALLDLRAWLVTFDGERRAELTLVLENDEPLAGPLGAVRLRGFRVVTSDPSLRFLPRFAAENDLLPAEPLPGGGFAQWLLRPGDHYLGDGTAKTFRFDLFQDGPDVGEAERRAAQAAVEPLAALADLDVVRRSGAFGLFGGPAPVDDDPGNAAHQVMQWRLLARFGPFGSAGDPANDGRPGHPRGGDAALHDVLRWRSPELLQVAELMVLQHTLRPTAGRRERQPPDTVWLRAGLGPLAQAAPHGFTPASYEHASALLVHDWWWLTGDPLARHEMQRLGHGVLALLRGAPFRTSRGEGNCLCAGVLCARGTGDDRLLAALAAHAREHTLPALFPDDSAVALPQPPHATVLDGETSFDASWQMAMLVRGLCALHEATGGADFAAAAVRVADAIAGAAWLDGEGPKTFVAARDPSRYTMAASPADRAGYDRMTIGAFVLAERLAGDPEVAARLRARARFLLDRELPVDAGVPAARAAATDPWLQVVLDREDK